jgi:ArsR family transcriptional regulator, lead/cadmium/zinc/bismuth-responsive transcriptional repressor
MIFSKTKNIDTDKQLVAIFSALGDKTRYQILKILSKEEDICVSELASAVGISNAGVSQQLKVLEQAGLVERNRMGQKICYSIRNNSDVNRKLYKLIS